MAQEVNGVTVAVIPLTMEQLQAISNCLHGRRQVRMKAEETWTALKHMELCQRVDDELTVMKAQAALDKQILSY